MRLPGPGHGTDIIVILVITIGIIGIIIIALVVTGNRRIFGGVVAARLCVVSHRIILWRAEAGDLGLLHSVFGARVRRGGVKLRKHNSRHPHWQSIE